MSDNFRDASRKHWIPTDGAYTRDVIQVGCLQRIADATEAMATNYLHMQNDRDSYKQMLENRTAALRRAERRIAALKGQVTKLKKKEPPHA